jgi:hypothetical protein
MYVKANISWRNRLPYIILLAAKNIIWLGRELLFPGGRGSKRTYVEVKAIL